MYIMHYAVHYTNRIVLASDRGDLTAVSNLIIDSVRSPRSDAYLMLKLIVSDRQEWVNNHERKSVPNPTQTQTQTLTLTLTLTDTGGRSWP